MSKWISIEDKKPEHDGRQYLLRLKNKKFMVGVYLKMWDRWSTIGCAKVTHWMPIPEFPEEEQE